METLYRKVEIKSEQDLPKETSVGSTDFYFVGCGNQKDVAYYSYTDKCWYNHEYAEIFDPEYYIKIQPVEPQERKEELITIPKWQMTSIEDVLRQANNIHHSQKKETCFDRCICKAWEFACKSLSKEYGFESIQPKQTAAEFLKVKYADDKWEPTFRNIANVMEEYAQPSKAIELREELIKEFAKGYHKGLKQGYKDGLSVDKSGL